MVVLRARSDGRCMCDKRLRPRKDCHLMGSFLHSFLWSYPEIRWAGLLTTCVAGSLPATLAGARGGG